MEFKADSEIRLEPGFAAWHGSKFWAHIADQHICNADYSELTTAPVARTGGTHYIDNEPALNTTATTQAINNTSNQDFYGVYPNPSADVFNVQFPGPDKYNIAIYNGIGEKLANFDISNQKQFVFDPADYNLSNGIYLMVMVTRDKTYREKLVVNH